MTPQEVQAVADRIAEMTGRMSRLENELVEIRRLARERKARSARLRSEQQEARQ